MQRLKLLSPAWLAVAACLAAGAAANAQMNDDTATQPGAVTPPAQTAPAVAVATAQGTANAVLPAETIVTVTPVDEITSMHMHKGDVERLQVAADVAYNGTVIIPRGAPVKATVTWRTGKGIVGKSAKFILTFNSVNVRGRDWALKGTHRQEGRGNTVAALLGSAIITGRSAVMLSGQVVNAFTAEPITAS
jgi:hypothetical protein